MPTGQNERGSAVTMKDIAREVGLSVTTVSRALNNYDDVSGKTRALVQRVARDLDYHPNAAARTLQNARATALGLLIPHVMHRAHDTFWLEFIAGIVATCARHGYDLLLSSPENHDSEDAAFRRLVRGRRVDGVLLCDVRREDRRVAYLRAHRMPFVAYGRTTDDHDYPYIDVDGEAGVVQAMDHLLELGHRRIAYLSVDPGFGFSYYRLAGYRRSLDRAGLRFDQSLVHEGLTALTAVGTVEKLLVLPDPPTAILASADFLGSAVLRALRAGGLVIPRDMSVVVFDDSVLVQHAEPALTAIRQPNSWIGEEAARLLLDRVKRPQAPLIQRLVVPTLVLRGSTGPPSPIQGAASA